MTALRHSPSCGYVEYIDHGTEPPQLFALSRDPDETTDLAGDPAHAQVQSELAASPVTARTRNGS